MTLEEMGPSLTVEGATTSAVFETYVEQVLAPTLRERLRVRLGRNPQPSAAIVEDWHS